MLTYAVIVSISLNIIVLIVLFAHVLKQRRALKHLGTIGSQASEGNLPYIINQSYDKITTLSDDLEKLNSYYSKLFRLTGATLQNVGLIRYDAFEEMGGNLSFSLALLNNQKDGVVLTSINGRTENRIYIKQIMAGISNDFPLTTEENKAVAQALKESRKMFSKKEAQVTKKAKSPKKKTG